MSLAESFVYAIVMILVAGLFGGGVNCLQARKADEPTPKSWVYYILLSVVAAFSVPLFLSLTKSALLDEVLSGQAGHAPSWFILFAVCLVAAVFAQNFLESVSSQLLKRMDNIEGKTEHATEIAAKAAGDSTKALNTAEASKDADFNRTPDPARASLLETVRKNLIATTPSTDPNEQKILDALKNPKYQLGRRTAGGVVGETKLPRAIVLEVLNRLEAAGVVEKATGETTDTEYYQLRG